MMLAWHWPWAALAGVLAALAIIVLIVVFARRNTADDTPVFSMDDDLNTEHASRLFRQWRALGRLAISVLVLALALAVVLVARPSQVDAGDERASSRDIVWMCRGPRSPMIAKSSIPIWNWSSISRGNVSV